ncbi:MAG: 3-deoxy-7-phosphoheptulonate synthase [Planctomycetes bacterium]|nr:3-deoxy-7-phosphoheptulonate synthase [Planctomycetota bacterium]
MIVVMQPLAGRDDVSAVISRVEAGGCTVHETSDDGRVVLGVLGRDALALRDALAALPCVERVVDIAPPYKLASREWRRSATVVSIGGVAVGAGNPVVIAGPCAVESWEQLLATAEAVKAGGAHLLRGGAFKPRTSPYAFRGLGAEGLKMLRAASDQTGLPVVTEILAPGDIDLFVQHADALQVGARNMQNFPLLDEVGRVGKPVVLKRGMMATIEELLLAAEYILARGNTQVILCERGIRTFETATRNTPDLAAIPVVKQLSHLPILFDPSHSTGNRRYVAPMARAAIAAGADGIMVEVHVHPEAALCDGNQALLPAEFAALKRDVDAIAAALR